MPITMTYQNYLSAGLYFGEVAARDGVNSISLKGTPKEIRIRLIEAMIKRLEQKKQQIQTEE